MLEAFLNIEINDATQKRILEVIKNACANNVEKEELTFNVYSVIIYPNRNELVLCNDIIDEIPDFLMPLDTFYNFIKKI